MPPLIAGSILAGSRPLARTVSGERSSIDFKDYLFASNEKIVFNTSEWEWFKLSRACVVIGNDTNAQPTAFSPILSLSRSSIFTSRPDHVDPFAACVGELDKILAIYMPTVETNAGATGLINQVCVIFGNGLFSRSRNLVMAGTVTEPIDNEYIVPFEHYAVDTKTEYPGGTLINFHWTPENVTPVVPNSTLYMPIRASLTLEGKLKP